MKLQYSISEREIDEQYQKRKIPVLSFFTGGGFLDLGFELAGFEVVWTNEANGIFADMYECGVTSWRRSIYPGSNDARISDKRSIAAITSKDILDLAFTGKRPPFFGIIGGPPCPDFSQGGKNLGGGGDKGHLSQIFIDRICEISPDFFVFENVPGLLRHKKHREFLAQLELQLENHRYCLDLRLLNVLDLGWPQNRERLILIGIKRNISRACIKRELFKGERGWFPWPEYPEYNGAKKRFRWPGVELLNETPQKPSDIPDKLMIYHLLDGDNPPSLQPNGLEAFKPYSDKFFTTCEGDVKGKSFKRLHRYRYSPTACYGNNEVHLHPWENRRLTVREAMRIQGIPDTYILQPDKPLTAKFALIGNGVPIPLAESVARSIHRIFDDLLRLSE
jgi:DNA (cytosine-5)-methyltransferase 1